MTVKTGSPGTKYITQEFSFWYQEDDESIHITSPDHGQFHTTVNDKPGSLRYHPNLFRKLNRILQEQGVTYRP